MGHGITAKRQFASQQLEQHDPERIKIRPAVHFMASDLFGRHETGGADHQAGFGPAEVRDACNPKVSDFHHVGDGVVHDVGWLDVTMHHVLLMRIGQRLGNLGHDRQYVDDRQQVSSRSGSHQIRSPEKLHDNVSAGSALHPRQK